ncbi:MAG: XkdX family protein [Promethearchaeota archaeon]
MLSGKGRYLKKLYEAGKITENELDNGVEKGWVTEEEKEEILEE